MVDLPGDPWAVNGPLYDAGEARVILGGVLGMAGLTSLGGCLVRATTPVTDSVEITAGFAYIRDAAGGYYTVTNSSTQTILISPTSVNGRIDLIVARVYDTTFADSSNKQTIELVPGTASVTPVAPAVPARSIVLAEVSMPPATSTVAGGQITDRRVSINGAMLTGPSVTRVAALASVGEGVFWRETVTNYVWQKSGGLWQLRNPLPTYSWKRASSGAFGATTWLNVPTESGSAVVDSGNTVDPDGTYFNMLFVERRLMILRAGLYQLNYMCATTMANVIARVGRVPSSNAVHDLVYCQPGSSGPALGTLNMMVTVRLAANTAVGPALYFPSAGNDSADAAAVPHRFAVTRLSD